MLGQHGHRCSSDQMTEHDRGDDRIVQRSRDRDELRDEVDRRRDPYDCDPEPQLGAPRHPRIPRRPRKSHRRLGISLASSRAWVRRPRAISTMTAIDQTARYADPDEHPLHGGLQPSCRWSSFVRSRSSIPPTPGSVPCMDFALPPAFERFPRHRAKAEAACRTTLADPDVVGMAVTGSFAAGNADEVSDVDLRVYARSGAVETVVARAGAGGCVRTRRRALRRRSPRDPDPHDRALRRPGPRRLRRHLRRPSGRAQPSVACGRAVGTGPDLRCPAGDVRVGCRGGRSMDGGPDLDVVLVHPVEGPARRALRSARRSAVRARSSAVPASRPRPRRGLRAGGERRPSWAPMPTRSRGRFRSRSTFCLMEALRAEMDLYRRLADPLLARHGVDLAAEAEQ